MCQPSRKDDRDWSRRKRIFPSRVCDAEKPRATSRKRITETGIAHCKHGKSINNFRIVFLQAAAGIQMRPPSRAKYVDIMDINIFIYDTPGCRCAPINHVVVILITFRIESVFPMLPRRKSRFVCNGCCNIYWGYTVIYRRLHIRTII